MKSFKNFILLLLIFFAVNFLNYSNDVKWECFLCEKRILVPAYIDPRDYRNGFLYGCPNNEVEGTHWWYSYH